MPAKHYGLPLFTAVPADERCARWRSATRRTRLVWAWVIAERRLDGDLPGARRGQGDVAAAPAPRAARACRAAASAHPLEEGEGLLRQRGVEVGSHPDLTAESAELPGPAASLDRNQPRMGFPLRVITTSSPRAALSSRRERWVLAAYTPTCAGASLTRLTQPPASTQPTEEAVRASTSILALANRRRAQRRSAPSARSPAATSPPASTRRPPAKLPVASFTRPIR